MARIISGGLKPIAGGSSGKETTPEYLLRNVAQVPASLYKFARTGAGIGELANVIGQEIFTPQQRLEAQQRGTPEWLLNSMDYLQSTLGAFGRERAERELQAFQIPEYFRKERPEDKWAQFALTALPFMGAGLGKAGIQGLIEGGGINALKTLGREAAPFLGIAAGGEAGSALGGLAGKKLGSERIGEALGGFGGGLLGAAGGHLATNLPSKAFPEKVTAAEKTAFEQGKQGRLAETEARFRPELEKVKESYKETLFREPKERETFESEKRNRIVEARKEIKNYKKEIKDIEKSRKGLYDTAASLEKGAKGDPAAIRNTLYEVVEDLGKGVNSADRNAIIDALSSTEGSLGKELSLRDAKTLQKNLNDQIYTRGSSSITRRQLGRVTNSLNEFISKIGSPEHNKAWKKAEDSHIKLKELQSAEPEFVRDKKTEISDIAKEKFPEAKQVQLNLNQKEALKELKVTEKEHKAAIDAIGKETFEELQKLNEPRGSLEKSLQSISGLLNNWSKAGIAGTIGHLLGGHKGGLWGIALGKLGQVGMNEIRLARQVFKNHPQLYAEWAQELKNLRKGDPVKVANALNILGSKIEEKSKEPTRQLTKGRIISGGFKKF